jgi:WXG100 family type VII secretion target
MIYSDNMPIAVRSELAGAGPFLTGQSETLQAELARLRSDIDNILAHWRGGANTYFTELKAEWDFAANGLFNGVLTSIAQALNVNWNNYEDAEAANRKTWMK